MPLHINDAGTWRAVQAVWLNDAGTWRRLSATWLNDAGTWRQVFVGDQISISDFTATSVRVFPTSATAQYQLRNDGNIFATTATNSVVDTGDWITPQTNMANYECRATLVSGTLTSGTTGAWMSLASTRSWTLGRSTIGISQASITLEIRRASDSVVMDTATISFNAEVES